MEFMGYDGILGLGPKSSYLANLGAMKVYNETASIFLGSPMPGSTEKSLISFGCDIPAKNATGKAFEKVFIDVQSNPDIWLLQSINITLGAYTQTTQADIHPSTFRPEYYGVAFPEKMHDAIYKEITTYFEKDDTITIDKETGLGSIAKACPTKMPEMYFEFVAQN